MVDDRDVLTVGVAAIVEVRGEDGVAVVGTLEEGVAVPWAEMVGCPLSVVVGGAEDVVDGVGCCERELDSGSDFDWVGGWDEVCVASSDAVPLPGRVVVLDIGCVEVPGELLVGCNVTVRAEIDWEDDGPTDRVVGNDFVWGSDLEVVMSTLGVGTGVGVTNFGMMGAIDRAHMG